MNKINIWCLIGIWHPDPIYGSNQDIPDKQDSNQWFKNGGKNTLIIEILKYGEAASHDGGDRLNVPDMLYFILSDRLTAARHLHFTEASI